MKVVFCCRLFSPHIGGVETHVGQISQRLKDQNEITVVTQQHDSSLPLHQNIDGITVWRIPVASNLHHLKWHVWRWWICHIKLIWQADIIHTHDVFFWMLPFRFLFFWKKFFMTFHGYEGVTPTSKQIFWHRLAALLTRGSISVGAFHQKWYGVKSSLITYGGVDSRARSFDFIRSAHSAPPRKRRGQDDIRGAGMKSVRLIFVGRLDQDTGIEAYISSLELLKNHKTEITLDVYGDGPLQSELAKLVLQKNLSVRFHGFTAAVEIPWQSYNMACVSGYLSILEALSFGLPIIATYQTDIKKDYLQMTPFAQWITIAHSPSEIAHSISHHSKLERAAVTWARSQTWQNVADDCRQLWKV